MRPRVQARASLFVEVGVAAGLAAVTLAVFWASVDFGFVGLDDDRFIVQNPGLRLGWSLQALAWSLAPHDAAWMPLTWLSYIWDATWFGIDPAAFHRTNVALHTTNVVLLFAALRHLTGSIWAPALAAGIFALHPLHVEPVAWVSGRKDVLAGTFLSLTLLLYSWWRRHPGSRGRRNAVVVAHVLTLLSKVSLIAAPVVLLLLDAWPLGRFRGAEGGLSRARLAEAIREKLPLFAVSLVALIVGGAGVSLTVQEAGYPMGPASPWDRLAYAVDATARTLAKTFWPANLAVFYARPEEISALRAGLLAGVLGVCTAVAVGLRRNRPAALVGWLWFLVLLAPVSGIVELGAPEAMADRYAYVPLAGIAVAVVWGIPWPRPGSIPQHVVAAVLGATLLAGLGVASARQLPVWRDGVSLLTHALAVGGESPLVHHALGLEWKKRGRSRRAEAHLQQAVRSAPGWTLPRLALGDLYAGRGKFRESERWYRSALEQQPDDAMARIGLAFAALELGRPNEALAHLRRVLEAPPELGVVQAHVLMGVALSRTGDAGAAEAAFRDALRTDPTSPTAHANLGLLLADQRRSEEAVSHLRAALAGGIDDPRVRAALHRATNEPGAR